MNKSIYSDKKKSTRQWRRMRTSSTGSQGGGQGEELVAGAGREEDCAGGRGGEVGGPARVHARSDTWPEEKPRVPIISNHYCVNLVNLAVLRSLHYYALSKMLYTCLQQHLQLQLSELPPRRRRERWKWAQWQACSGPSWLFWYTKVFCPLYAGLMLLQVTLSWTLTIQISMHVTCLSGGWMNTRNVQVILPSVTVEKLRAHRKCQGKVLPY